MKKKILNNGLKIKCYRNITIPTLNKEAVNYTKNIETSSSCVLENFICFYICEVKGLDKVLINIS